MKLQHLIFLRFNNIFSTNLFRIQQITITTTRFIQNVRLLHPCRPSVASESCPRSWSKFPRWFRSMPSSKLASRIPHSGGVSHTLFLLECSTQSNPEGSNLVSLAAIHRRCCRRFNIKKLRNFTYSFSIFMRSNYGRSQFIHFNTKTKF